MDIALNIVVSLLLIITIIFCFRLSRRISAFNTNKVELSKFLGEFNKSIAKAEANINGLKAMGTEVDENLKSQIKKARFLANDLSFLAEKGENVANSLEGKISMSREMYKRAISETSRDSGGLSSSPSSITRKAPQQNASSIARASRSQEQLPRQDNKISDEAINYKPNLKEQPSANQMSLSKKKALNSLLKEIARKKGTIGE